MSTETQHATVAEMVAITSAHTDSDAVIVARIRAVSAALRRGVTVKILVADMAQAATDGVEGIAPIGQSMLGYSTAVIDLLESFGMSPASALKVDRASVVAIYKGIVRVKSRAVAFKVLKPAGKSGESDAERLAAMALAAKSLVRPAKTPRTGRPASESDDVTSADDGGSANVTSVSGAVLEEKFREKRVTLAGNVLGALIVGITRDGLVVTAGEAAKLQGLMNELARILPREVAPAPRPTKSAPAPRPTKSAA